MITDHAFVPRSKLDVAINQGEAICWHWLQWRTGNSVFGRRCLAKKSNHND